MERNLARIVANWSSHGHALGKCRVLLPPEVVIRPGRFNIRVRRVLVVMDVASGPEADATHPAAEVVGDDVEGHPDGVGAKASGR